MNPRIFKKLTQQASAEIERLGLSRHLGERFLAGIDGDGPEVCRRYKWERKSMEHWCGKPSRYPMIRPGTVGYGQMVGYYEPEWDDSDALSCLFSHVFERFTDWSTCDGESWPENHCPAILKRSARHMLQYAKTLPAEQKRRLVCQQQ